MTSLDVSIVVEFMQWLICFFLIECVIVRFTLILLIWLFLDVLVLFKWVDFNAVLGMASREVLCVVLLLFVRLLGQCCWLAH